MFHKEKGFTLVELLVAISIMSIILIMAIPSIGAIQQRNANKRYKNYGETLISSGKLYTDSNNIDMFGYEQDGCYDIKFESMVDKKLAKDIDYKDVTCADKTLKRTFVRVKRLDGQYKYQLSMYCVDSKGNMTYSNLMKDKEPICAGEKSYLGPEVIINPEKTNGWSNNKNYKVSITVKDDDGLLENNELEYAWCSKSDCSDVTSYTKISFKNKRDVKKASEKIKRPKNDGIYYLAIRSVKIVDVFNHASNVNKIAGPYKLDATPPTCESSGGRTTWLNSSVAGGQTIYGKCTDNLSGCVENEVKKDFTADKKGNESPGTVRDNAGNSTTCENQQIMIDKTAPTCTSSGGSTGWGRTAVTVKGECKDNLSGCVKATIQQTFSQNGNYAGSPGTVQDVAGNNTPCAAKSVLIDTVAPTCTVKKSNNKSSSGITIKVTCGDALSGVSNCWTSSSAKTVTKTKITSTVQYNKSSATNMYKTYRVTDKAGNIKACAKVTVTKQKDTWGSCVSTKNTCKGGNVSTGKFKWCYGRSCSSCSYSDKNTALNDCVAAHRTTGGSTKCSTSGCTKYDSCATGNPKECVAGWKNKWTNDKNCKAKNKSVRCRYVYS